MNAPALLPHPLAELFPMLLEREIGELADDICTFGQRMPIVLLDGKILDGRNRYAACLFAQIEPVTVDYDGDDPLNFVLSHNLHRRHLSDSQRAMVAAKIVDWEIGLNQHSGRDHVPAHKAAERLSISERAVKAARRIHEHGTAELVGAIRDGRLSVRTGEALSHLEDAAQLAVLEREEREIIARAKAIRASRQKLRHSVRLAHLDMIATRGAASAPIWWKDGDGPTYPIIYADPPWRHVSYSAETGSEKAAENHYPTIEIGDIAALGCPAAKNAALFLWVTDLANGIRVMEAWGFAFKSFWAWKKLYAGKGHGTGYWCFDNLELLLIGTRGDFPAPLPGTQPIKCTDHPVSDHSKKPDFYAAEIERLWPGVPKLEMFRRAGRPGWDVWGFEAQSVESLAPPAKPKRRAPGSRMVGA